MKKRLAAILLTLAMVISMLPGLTLFAYAADEDVDTTETVTMSMYHTGLSEQFYTRTRNSTGTNYKQPTITITDPDGVLDADKTKVTVASNNSYTADTIGTVNIVPEGSKSGTATVKVEYWTGTNSTVSNWVLHSKTYTVNIEKDFAKNSEWIEEGKTARITIESTRTKETVGEYPNVLFLGSLCNRHSLTPDIVNGALNSIAQDANVDYYFFGASSSLGTSNLKAPIENHIDRGGVIPTKLTSNNFTAGTHVSYFYFADVINSIGDLDDYDLIILEFDGMKIGDLDSDDIEDHADLVTSLNSVYNNNNYKDVSTGAKYPNPMASGANSTEKYDLLMAHLGKAGKELAENDDKVVWLIPDKHYGTKSGGENNPDRDGYAMYWDGYGGGDAAGKAEEGWISSKTTDQEKEFIYNSLSIISPTDWLVYDDEKKEYTTERNDEVDASQFTSVDSLKDLDWYDKAMNGEFDKSDNTGMWAMYGDTTVVTSLLEAKAMRSPSTTA